MKERRPLTDGVGPIDRKAEEEFVYRGKSPTSPTAPPPAYSPQSGEASASRRLPVSTRIRADYATALKRASLERQLAGVTPNTLQEILEEALGPWLAANGYLTPPRR